MPRKTCLILLGLTLVLGGCQPQESETEPNTLKLSQAAQPPSLKSPQKGAALKDFTSITDVGAKKRAFFDYMEPQIALENQHIGTLKEHIAVLQKLLNKQGQLHPKDADWLNRAAKLYRVDTEDPEQQLTTLQTKLGKIPSALVKAQAANESAWGTSRFAREANNLFGQWCFTPGCGIAPLQRNPEDTHEVQSFPSVAAGLRSYFINLNANQSYTRLRQIRRCLQANNEQPTGRALAAGLVNYSARGGHYVDEMQSMIRINTLEPWDSAWWGERDSKHPCYEIVQITTDHPDPVKDETPDTEAIPVTAEQQVTLASESATQIGLLGLVKQSPPSSTATAASSAALPSIEPTGEPEPVSEPVN